ncbi:MAG: zinc ribbon domain-containing protein [Methanomassiliicoccaceae archaeon]|nr:zinc ribbon domain-containing protein [Methanomassiliicoccaceae archaeon]
MNNTAGAKTFDLKWFGTLSPIQLLGVVGAPLIALVLTLLGFGALCSCLGMLMIAIVLYMLPKMLGVENIKLMTLVGVLFTVAAVLIGGLVMAPMLVEDNQGDPPDNDFFTDIEYTFPGDGVEISAKVIGDMDSRTVYFKYGEVKGVGFGIVNALTDIMSPMDVTGGIVSGAIALDPDKLYVGYLTIKEDGPDGETTVEGSDTSMSFLTGAFDGSITPLCLWGCFMGTLYIVIIFFMIMIFSSFMRTRMEKTRQKMEKEGRLYPQGYGKCEECGAIVLPGEVSCRKCGAYIDRPEEMKPKKMDFFECSECGAEVPGDAKLCPKCGAPFDEDDEIEIVHADGTSETTRETTVCPECGASVPATASFCTKCGAKFDKSEK